MGSVLSVRSARSSFLISQETRSPFLRCTTSVLGPAAAAAPSGPRSSTRHQAAGARRGTRGRRAAVIVDGGSGRFGSRQPARNPSGDCRPLRNSLAVPRRRRSSSAAVARPQHVFSAFRRGRCLAPVATLGGRVVFPPATRPSHCRRLRNIRGTPRWWRATRTPPRIARGRGRRKCRKDR